MFYRVSNGGSAQSLIWQATLKNINGSQTKTYTFPDGISAAIVITRAGDQTGMANRWHFAGNNCVISEMLNLSTGSVYEKVLNISGITNGSSFSASYDYGYSADAYIFY